MGEPAGSGTLPLQAAPLAAKDRFAEIYGREKEYILKKNVESFSVPESLTGLLDSAINKSGDWQYVAREPGTDENDEKPSPSYERPAAGAVVDEYTRGRDAATDAWVYALRTHDCAKGNLLYLDYWLEDGEASSTLPGLQRTERLLKEGGVKMHQLYSANADLGIVERMQNRGVVAYHGGWREAPFCSKFSGAYMNLCTGSVDSVLANVSDFLPLAASPCVLGFTLHQRDFAGVHLVKRSLRLAEYMIARGWKPAIFDSGLEQSSLVHKSSHGLDVVTQFWAKD